MRDTACNIVYLQCGGGNYGEQNDATVTLYIGLYRPIIKLRMYSLQWRCHDKGENVGILVVISHSDTRVTQHARNSNVIARR